MSGEGAGPGAAAPSPPPPQWVRFDEERPQQEQPAVLAAETVQVDIETSARHQNHNHGQPQQQQPSSTTSAAGPTVTSTTAATPNAPTVLRTVVRQGFANGDVVVTLLPVNTSWPWITPAQFRPELVPEELMAQGLTLTVEEYVHAMELLVNDYRFTIFNVFYKRVLVLWIFVAFLVLMALLFSGITGLTLFSFGLVWLLFNACAICGCMWIKVRLAKGLERCLGHVNKQLLKHRLLLALDDRGKMSCHKVNLCFVFFDAAPCIAQLQQVIEREEGAAIAPGWERRLDVQARDIVIQGSQTTRLSRRQERAAELYLRYASRWAQRALAGKLDVGALAPGLHSALYQCPCQFVREHLLCKGGGGFVASFCPDAPTIVFFV